MDCKTARDQFALLLYGELSFDEEERIEAHLGLGPDDGCAECRQALARQKNLHEALHSTAVSPSPDLLASSRAQLAQRLDQEAPRNWWSELVSNLRLRWAHPLLQPLAAVALLTVGFFGAKLTPNFAQQAGLVNFSSPSVRTVVPSGDGRIQIVINESRERTVEGRMDDQNIRTLLMSAATSAPDAGVREQTITFLVNGVLVNGAMDHGADAAQVRDALMFALVHDENDRVRAKAIEGLKPYARELAVQQAIAQSMLNEGDVGVREQAVELLTGQPTRDQQVVGALQELMIREQNRQLREQVRQILEAVNASTDMY